MPDDQNRPEGWPEDWPDEIGKILPEGLKHLARELLSPGARRWPAFLAAAVKAIVDRPNEPNDLPNENDIVEDHQRRQAGRKRGLKPWFEVLTRTALREIVDELRALSLATDPDDRGDHVRRLRHAYRLFKTYAANHDIAWPKWLSAGEEYREDAGRSWAALKGPNLNFPDDVRELFFNLAPCLDPISESYELWFPVVLTDHTGQLTREGYLVRSRVILLSRRRPASELPRIGLAPWSLVGRSKGQMEALQTRLEEIAHWRAECAGFLGGRDILLELLPAENPVVQQPPGLPVDGDSLELAVVLACWAATKKPLLRRIVLTGQIGKDGFESIHAADIKAEVVGKLAADEGRRYVFLVPEDSAAETVLKSFPLVNIELVGKWDSLFEITSKHLTDGFDGYRQRLADARSRWGKIPANDEGDDFGQWRTADVADLDELVSGLAVENPPVFNQVALPFGNDPQLAARYVVGEYCRRIQAALVWAGRNDETPVPYARETPVPLLVPFRAGQPSRNESLEETVNAGSKVWKDLPLQENNEDTPWPSDAHVRRTVREFSNLLLLVLYSVESRSIGSFDMEKARIQKIFEPIANSPDRLPRIVLIASDEHHRRLLEPIVRAVCAQSSA